MDYYIVTYISFTVHSQHHVWKGDECIIFGVAAICILQRIKFLRIIWRTHGAS